jgi:hypothetical protein
MQKNRSRETLKEDAVPGFSDMILSDNEDNELKDHWITLVEDGSDLANCKKCKINIRKF